MFINNDYILYLRFFFLCVLLLWILFVSDIIISEKEVMSFYE